MAKKVYFKKWREHAGLTQKRASVFLGLSRTYLSKIESSRKKSRKRYNQDFLERAAKTYRCAIADLYRDPNDPFLQVERMMQRLDPTLLPAVVRYVRMLLGEIESDVDGTGNPNGDGAGKQVTKKITAPKLPPPKKPRPKPRPRA